MSSSDIFVGFGLTVILAVACQIAAGRLRIPAIIVLLPVGFFAGRLVTELNPQKTLGPAFSPLVALAVAVILFDGGLELRFRDLEGDSQRVVRRLIYIGVPVTWTGAALLSGPLLGLSNQAALMLGAILIVSGPTVVAPLLDAARPGRRVSRILDWECVTIDPIGAIIGAIVFSALKNHVRLGHGAELLAFLKSVGVGALGGAVGAVLLFLLLNKLQLKGVLATEALVGVVIGTAALCDAVRDDSGLIAAIVMGVVIANLPQADWVSDRLFFKTVVQFTIGLLFISISATVSSVTLRPVVLPVIILVLILAFVVRPVIAAVSTARTSLTVRERAFIGWMDPRGIVAASTAATFTAPLVQEGVGGAGKILPVTFLVIVATVTLYGLTAVPVSRLLGLRESAQEEAAEPQLPDEPEAAAPTTDE
jgi:NhaP-type Na+/H+ or K+/H+ antiporter